MSQYQQHDEQQSMTELWNRFTSWIENNAPDLLDQVKEGASSEAIQGFEGKLGITLPEDVKAFYAYHDGQEEHSDGLFDSEELLCLDRIIDEWTVWNDLLQSGDFVDDGQPITSDPQPGIKNDWWNPKWIPLTYDGAGNHFCLDLDPAEGGSVGQVIRMWHDDAERELKASSFKEFIASYITALEKGDFVYNEDWGGIVSKEEAEDE